MGELTICRNRGFTPPQFQTVGKTAKQSGVSQSQQGVKSAADTISDTLRQLMARVSQAEGRTRESRRTLQGGESVLTEVDSGLDRLEDLLRRSAGRSDRAPLQAELEGLLEDIDRIIGSATAGGKPLFLDGDMGLTGEAAALLSSLMGEMAAKGEGELPDWLTLGITQAIPSADQILAELGLDKTASAEEILAALQNHPPERCPVTGTLASLYLGAVISGCDLSQGLDPQKALEGLRQLLYKIGEGVPLDEAIETLTGGEFTSLDDFQAQFMGGSAPGLKDFLVNLLLADGGSLLFPNSPLLALLAGLEGSNLELLMGLLTTSQGPGAPLEQPAAAGAGEGEGVETASPSNAVMELKQAQVTGQDLSGVSFQAEKGVLTVGGTADVAIQGMGEAPGALTVLITGSGTVTIQNLDAAKLIVDTAMAQLLTAGGNRLAEVLLKEGSSLTLGGGGLLRLGLLQANDSNTLRLTGGAVAVEEPGEGEGSPSKPLAIPVLLEGAASFAARAGNVHAPNGVALEPLDVVWKALLPGWKSVSAIAIDGRQTKLALLNGDPMRLWLEKGDPSHGAPIHTLMFRGKDGSGRLQSRYAYLRWSQYANAFEPVSLYPNPFTITGGEDGRDWVYEEETHTLRILSNQVTAISGGAGTDANQSPFSGRIALADQIGRLKLALNGVVCRVSSGRAFDLGRENKVALILENGTRNFFESGSGCAGISLGEGTSLSIDCEDPHDSGALTATGGAGGAGIGRDSGGGRDQASQITIYGGAITASGSGGGAGIGAGKHGFMGSITIIGGVVDSTGGKGGGAGIGGALGAAVGDITIHGGSVTAVALHHAAAIGAGVQGECGNILITGTARILRAAGGPGGDIGSCLFGGCGRVLVSGGADIGEAKLSTQTGIPLDMGEDTVTLPQFQLSAKALRLDGMDLATPEGVQFAQSVLDADRRWISQIRGVYNMLYSQLEQNYNSLNTVQQYISVKGGGPVRDTATASTLLEDMRRSIIQSPQALLTHGRHELEDIQHLLQ